MAGPYGDTHLGRLALAEDTFEVDTSPDGTVAVTVRVSPTDGPVGYVERRVADLLALEAAQLLPVRFSTREFLSGFYQVATVAVSHGSYPRYWVGDTSPRVAVAVVKLTLIRVGFSNTVDVESRLSGARTRVTDYPVVGEVWHAPPVGHAAYRTQVAARTVRQSTDGPVIVYRGLPADGSPRWTADLDAFTTARARFLDEHGEERDGVAGINIRATTITGGLYPAQDLYPADDLYPDDGVPDVPGFELSNGLVRVTHTPAGLFAVAGYDGTAWSTAKAWDVVCAGGSLAPFTSMELIHNSYDTVVARLVTGDQPHTSTVDLTVRRGARSVEVAVRTTLHGLIRLCRATTEAGTAGTGWVTAAADDVDGHRYVCGAVRAHTLDPLGGVAQPATSSLDGFVGLVVNGAAAQPGDTAADLFAQFLGAPAEVMVGVRR